MTASGDMPDAAAQQQTFSLANVVPQTAWLNRGIYLVAGPAFLGSQLQSIGVNGVLVPSSTWKAVYDPQVAGTGAYVCHNSARPSCFVVSVAALIQAVGIDPFPGLPVGIKSTAMALPAPEVSVHGPRRHRQSQALLDGPPRWIEAP